MSDLVDDFSLGGINYQEGNFYQPVWPAMYQKDCLEFLQQINQPPEGSQFRVGHPDGEDKPTVQRAHFFSKKASVKKDKNDPTQNIYEEQLPEKMQIDFLWQSSNYRLDIPLENIDKIEVKVEPILSNQGIFDEDTTVMFIHLHKPVNVNGEVKG